LHRFFKLNFVNSFLTIYFLTLHLCFMITLLVIIFKINVASVDNGCYEIEKKRESYTLDNVNDLTCHKVTRECITIFNGLDY
jgi:hypothetical protein